MKRLTNYIILPALKIMVECYKGELSAEAAISYKKALLKDPDYDPSYNIITDLREIEVNISSENLHQITEFFDFLKDTPVKRKVSLITDKPSQTVLAHFFKELGRESIIQYDVFCTLEAALEYVGLTKNELNLIDETLQHLSRNTST